MVTPTLAVPLKLSPEDIQEREADTVLEVRPIELIPKEPDLADSALSLFRLSAQVTVLMIVPSKGDPDRDHWRDLQAGERDRSDHLISGAVYLIRVEREPIEERPELIYKRARLVSALEVAVDKTSLRPCAALSELSIERVEGLIAEPTKVRELIFLRGEEGLELGGFKVLERLPLDREHLVAERQGLSLKRPKRSGREVRDRRGEHL